MFINFNPRSPWGERLTPQCSPISVSHFNPRSPWGERPPLPKVKGVTYQFQSTLSVRRATLNSSKSLKGLKISIHALREESDVADISLNRSHNQFQSTLSVRRATILWVLLLRKISKFQSTLSVRRATIARSFLLVELVFQSTLSVRRATWDWYICL